MRGIDRPGSPCWEPERTGPRQACAATTLSGGVEAVPQGRSREPAFHAPARRWHWRSPRCGAGGDGTVSRLAPAVMAGKMRARIVTCRKPDLALVNRVPASMPAAVVSSVAANPARCRASDAPRYSAYALDDRLPARQLASRHPPAQPRARPRGALRQVDRALRCCAIAQSAKRMPRSSSWSVIGSAAEPSGLMRSAASISKRAAGITSTGRCTHPERAARLLRQ